MVRMLEIADVAVADAAHERDTAHHPVAFERTARARLRAKRSETARYEPRRSLEVVRRQPRDQVHRAADGIASIQRALRSAKYFDSIDVDELDESHRWTSEVHAVEIHDGTRIGAGVHRIGADPANGQLTEACILRKGD